MDNHINNFYSVYVRHVTVAVPAIYAASTDMSTDGFLKLYAGLQWKSIYPFLYYMPKNPQQNVMP